MDVIMLLLVLVCSVLFVSIAVGMTSTI